MLIPFDKPENLSTTFDKAKDSDKPTNPTDDSITSPNIHGFMVSVEKK